MTFLLPIVANAFSGEVEIDGIKYYIVTKARSAEVRANNYSGDVVIPSSVTYEGVVCNVEKIGDKAFHKCNEITSITLPSSISTIGNYAFAYCTRLNDIIIPPSVTNIEEGTFEGCSGLSSVNIPSTITQIGNRAFSWCTGLSSVVIPASVSKIGNDAFTGCTGLTSVKMSPSVTHIGARAFQNCKGLIYVALPSSIIYIGSGAFSECSGLKTMVIPPLVDWIYDNTFSGCTSLTSLIIPSSVYRIGLYAFSSCPELTDVYSYVTNVPIADNTVFYGSEINYATLHVPEKSIEAYKNYTPWMEFREIVKLKPMFALTYIINDDVYISYQVEEGASITVGYEPTKEGYTFNALSHVPETMPSHDLTVTGSFSVNFYTLTYTVDGVVYKTNEVEYGTTIIPEEAPTKTGYTFSGWGEIPSTMPAKDVTLSGTFSINNYKLTYIVDGEEYKSEDVEYNSTIAPEAEPTKEGYTFSGWSGIPETMPANDVTVTGSFTVNSYTLTYMVDGKVYKTSEVDYGTTITPEAAPTKTGYSFSGWDDVPVTMPAEDVTVSGTFTINSYKLTYIVDDEEYKTFEIVYDSVITPEAEPIKEGYTFSGWSDIPETMPAEDVTVTGSFIVNKYQITFIIDGEVFATDYVEYGATIVPPTVEEREGYSFSGWNDIPETMPANDVEVHASYTSGIIDVLMETQRNLRIYSPDGKKLEKLQRGLNIMINDDGIVKKVMVK